MSGKSSKAIRDKDGKVLQAAEFQSTEATPGRIQPDRRWFGNTRTISQTALDHFRETLKDKIADPYAVVLKQNKLPMSLLSDSVRGVSHMWARGWRGGQEADKRDVGTGWQAGPRLD